MNYSDVGFFRQEIDFKTEGEVKLSMDDGDIGIFF